MLFAEPVTRCITIPFSLFSPSALVPSPLTFLTPCYVCYACFRWLVNEKVRQRCRHSTPSRRFSYPTFAPSEIRLSDVLSVTHCLIMVYDMHQILHQKRSIRRRRSSAPCSMRCCQTSQSPVMTCSSNTRTLLRCPKTQLRSFCLPSPTARLCGVPIETQALSQSPFNRYFACLGRSASLRTRCVFIDSCRGLPTQSKHQP